MDFRDLKHTQILKELGIEPSRFGQILCFVDFANVNRWYDTARTGPDGNPIPPETRVEIELRKFCDFLGWLGDGARFYYGLDVANSGSRAFIKAAVMFFGKHRVFTKPIQQIRHDLTPEDSVTNTRMVHTDRRGNYVYIPKCNFDVEIAVDAMRLASEYDTICLLSGDADFVALLRYLKRKGKKVILVKGGRITKALGELADLKLEAEEIRRHITYVKAGKARARP